MKWCSKQYVEGLVDLLAIAIDRLLADCLLHDTSFADCLLAAFGVCPTRARERELARYSDR